MAKKTVYVVNGKELVNMNEVVNELGFKVTKRDILSGEVEGVEVRVIDPEDTEPVADTTVEEPAATEEPTDGGVTLDEGTEDDSEPEDSAEDDTQDEDSTDEEPKQDTKPTITIPKANVPVARATVNDNPVLKDVEYPEKGHFKDDKAMKKFIKKLTDEQLQEWCELEGVEWKANEHQAINRMRMAMAIKGLHFPATAPAKSSKKKSKYSDYTTEQLVQMAMDHDIEVRDDKGNERILRMYTIMALREAGLIG